MIKTEMRSAWEILCIIQAQAAALQRLPALAASPELAALYQAGYYDALHAIGVACGLNPQEMRLPDPDPRQQRAR